MKVTCSRKKKAVACWAPHRPRRLLAGTIRGPMASVIQTRAAAGRITPHLISLARRRCANALLGAGLPSSCGTQLLAFAAHVEPDGGAEVGRKWGGARIERADSVARTRRRWSARSLRAPVQSCCRCGAHCVPRDPKTCASSGYHVVTQCSSICCVP